MSRHGQVESRFADVGLHPVNRLPQSGAEQIGIEQLDDIWKAHGEGQGPLASAGWGLQRHDVI